MDRELFARGEQMRRTVLGEEHIAAATAMETDFARPLRDLVTEFCWGGVWGRDGLPLATRSLLNIVMLLALDQEREFRIHVRGALRNGCTERELQEALLQTAPYLGLPAAIKGFRAAIEVLAEVERERGVSDGPAVAATEGPDADDC